MYLRLMLTVLLCFTSWVNFVQTSAACANNCCCISWSKTQVRWTQIKNYAIQRENRCLINAIVFETKRGQIICSNPNNEWAKQVIRKMETEAISSGSSDQGE